MHPMQEVAKRSRRLFGRHARDTGHGVVQPAHVARRHVPQHRRRRLLTHAEQDQRRTLGTIEEQ